MKDYSYKILSEKNKQIEITYKGRTLRFQLKVKRSFTVIKRLLETYPDYFNIHELDKELNDPNKAHSDLRIANGFAPFLEEKRGDKRIMHVRLNLDELFKHCRADNPNEFLFLHAHHQRSSFDNNLKDKIFKKFDGKCNITGLKLYEDIPDGQIFLKNFLTPVFDHRRPLSKNGSNDEYNLQLISKGTNEEKNKICNSCNGLDCEHCALAYPEKFNIIQPTGQDIQRLRIRTKQQEN